MKNLWHLLILFLSSLCTAMMGALYNSPGFMVAGVAGVLIALAIFMNEVRKL